MKKLWFFGLLAALIAVGAGWFALQSQPDDRPATTVTKSETEEPTEPVAVPKLLIGSTAAKVTLVQYGDFQCSICGRFFAQTEPELKKQYFDTGKVKLEYRVLANIGPESFAAGEAAYCAQDQGKFAAYHDLLYQKQGAYNSGVYSQENLKTYAEAVGLDSVEFGTCLDNKKYHQTVIEGTNRAIADGYTATPIFLLGGQVIRGAQPFSVFQTLIDAELK